MANKLLEKAINEVENLLSGEEFMVKDLFKGYEWKRFSIKDRLLLGTLFLNEVNTNTSLKIKKLPRASSQRYKKL